jgi:hypothetical protein
MESKPSPYKWEPPLQIVPLPSNIEEIVYPLMGMCSKLVLGGSLGLYVMDIMDYDFNKRKPDIDFSLTEPLTAEELNIIKDFFQLEFVLGSNDYDFEEVPASLTEDETIRKTKSAEYFLTKELIQLRKYDEDRNTLYTIDIFNSQYLKQKDAVEVRIPFKETPNTSFNLRLNHPSITLSYKARYAYDTRVGKQFKHWDDIEKMDKKKYFKIIKNIKVRTMKPLKDAPPVKVTYYDPHNNLYSTYFQSNVSQSVSLPF